MEVDGGDPSSVNKNPGIIKAAQEEIAALDILVCGNCNYVYHFIEEFQDHKNANACGKPTFKANLSESKPQVWAFLLWKSSIVNKHKASGNKDPINSWKLYQQWCRMNEKVRDAWVVAGKNIQQFSTLANAKMAEVHSKKGMLEIRPKIVSTKSLLTDDDEELKGNGDKKNEKIFVAEAPEMETVRKIVRIPAEKVVGLKETRLLPNVQANKDVRTYTAKKISENEESVENTSNAVITNNDGAEENGTTEEVSSKTESIKETTNEEAKTSENEKEPEKTKQDDITSSRTPEKTLVKDPLGDGMVEIKVENASSEDEQECVDEQEERENLPTDQERESNADQQSKTSHKKLLATNRAIRSRKPGDGTKEGDASSEDEYVVEKILAKRFNPKKKCFEYLLKWEGYPHDQNTWEPVENMAACDRLVETFEANLAKQRAANQRGMGASKQALHTRPVKVIKNTKAEMDVNQPGPSGVNTFESRPVRSSKKRAMEQVKSWCGTMQRKEFEIGKRKFGEESDTDDDFDVLPSDKKIKLEPPDEEWSGAEMDTSLNSPQSSEEEGTEKKKKLTVVAVQGNQSRVVGTVHRSAKSPSHAGEEVIKRGPGRPPKRLQALEPNSTVNGMTKNKNSAGEKGLAVELGLASDSSPEHKTKTPQSSVKLSSQPPVLVANSKGVIKVDPRQVPNLTSGVYIVSNKSGIVKLDSAPGSPTKDKTSEARQSPQGQSPGTAGVVINKSGIQTGIVRKPLSPSSTVVRALGQNSVKQATKPAVPLKSPINTNSGLVKVSSLNSKPTAGLSPRLGTPTTRPLLMSPRVLGSRPSLSSPRPLSILSQRPGLVQSVRPGLQPRMPGVPLRPSLGNAALKKSAIGVPGIQTKITSAVRPKTPLQSPLGRGMSKAPSPAAQVKSGVKPIQAMLGKAVQQNSGTNTSLTSHRLILPKKQNTSSGTLMSTNVGTVKPGAKAEDQKLKKPVGRGRGRGYAENVMSIGRAKDSKLVENNGLHMEFHEVNSSSDSDDGFDSLPELPMGDLPPLEPDSPPRPFTLCPETGKILGQAEGEPTPVPSPEPEIKAKEEPQEILPDKQESMSNDVPSESSQENQEGEKETVLKLEMSPGGTTGTVIESNTVPSTYVDTLRTQEGLTVTKISTTSTSSSESQQQVVVTTSKVGGGISVPAKKLFADSSSSNNDVNVGGSNNALNAEMVAITGEDGMVYHIATEEEHDGETMIVSTDGNQCVYVTAEQAAGLGGSNVLTLDTAVAEAVAQLMPDQVNVIGGGTGGCSQFYVKEGDADSGQLMISSDVDQSEETTQAQIIAQVVQEAEPMAETGGTRRVVLLLPDGNLMMTEVDEEQYAALNIENDK